MAPALGVALLISASSRGRSSVGRTATSAEVEKRTNDARSPGTRLIDCVGRGPLRALPLIAVPHAVGAIEQDHHVARAVSRCGQASCRAETDGQTRRRSTPARPGAAPAAPSCESAAGAPIGTAPASGTSATGTRRRSSAPSESDESEPESRARLRPAKNSGARNDI